MVIKEQDKISFMSCFNVINHFLPVLRTKNKYTSYCNFQIIFCLFVNDSMHVLMFINEDQNDYFKTENNLKLITLIWFL